MNILLGIPKTKRLKIALAVFAVFMTLLIPVHAAEVSGTTWIDHDGDGIKNVCISGLPYGVVAFENIDIDHRDDPPPSRCGLYC